MSGSKVFPALVFGTVGLVVFRAGMPCSISGHRTYYSPKDDESFCKKCSTRWRDASIDGSKAGKYTPETGWIYEGEREGYDVHN